MTTIKVNSRPVIRTRAASLVRGEGVEVLTDINWEVLPGEHWAILGANGSGKTSLLKLICGYAWPTQGRVEVLGVILGEIDVQEMRKSLGWVSSALETRIHISDSALEVALSGLEASIGLWREFTPKETRRAARILKSLGAGPYAERRYEFLSQGERQRVLIARATINRPKILILDEPCAGLDPTAREDFLDDVTRFAQGPRPPTILMVTHHIEDIPKFVSHALILSRGRAVASGPIARVCTSEVLSEAYGRAVRVSKKDARFQLSFLSRE